MFVEVSETGCAVREATDLKSLSVLAADRGHLGALGDLGTVDGDHVWLSIDGLKAAAAATLPEGERTAWAEGYDGMIAYARSKGWASPDGDAVRAHVADQ